MAPLSTLHVNNATVSLEQNSESTPCLVVSGSWLENACLPPRTLLLQVNVAGRPFLQATKEENKLEQAAGVQTDAKQDAQAGHDATRRTHLELSVQTK